MNSGSGRSSRWAWRAAQRSALAALGAALCSITLAALFPGCLNPRPDDYPSAANDPAFSGEEPAVTPDRETCEDNPLLAECSPPSSEGSAGANGAPSGDPIELGGDSDAGVADGGTQ